MEKWLRRISRLTAGIWAFNECSRFTMSRAGSIDFVGFYQIEVHPIVEKLDAVASVKRVLDLVIAKRLRSAPDCNS